MVLLSVGVVLTIALSVVARSITDVSTSTKGEESLRAFSAAEAGVENTLNKSLQSLPIVASPTPVAVGTSGSTYTTSLLAFPQTPRSYLYPVELSAGDSATVWLSSHDPVSGLTCTGGSKCFQGSTLDLCWGKTGSGTQPAIAISVLYEDPAGGGVRKYAYIAYDSNGSRASQNHFITSGISSNTGSGACNIGGTALANKVTLNLASDLSIPNNAINSKRLKSLTALLLYNTTPTVFGVTNLPDDLPDQGKQVDSVGTAGTSTRKVQVFSLYPEIPSMFQSALYSPPGIVK
jgi:hypothetical protein